MFHALCQTNFLAQAQTYYKHNMKYVMKWKSASQNFIVISLTDKQTHTELVICLQNVCFNFS